MRLPFVGIILLVCCSVSVAVFGATSYKLTGVVNLNTATLSELDLLPGIGEAKAMSIMEHRSKRPFVSLNELLLVKGIGEKLLVRIKPYLVVSGVTTLVREKDGVAGQD